MRRRSFLPLLLGGARAWASDAGFVSLMPEKDVREKWTIEGPAHIWSVRDGVIACKGRPLGFLRSKKSYRNYVLRAEWRFELGWTKAPERWPNAGFFIHAQETAGIWPRSLEVQGYWGQAASVFGVRGGWIGDAWRGPLIPMKQRPPFGSWDRYEIVAYEGNVKVWLNGRFENEGCHAEPSEGNICLQSEGWPVYYRNVAIRELDAAGLPAGGL